MYRALKRAGLIDPHARRRRDRKFRRWERGGAMELRQMDVVGGAARQVVAVATASLRKLLHHLEHHASGSGA